MKWLPNSRYWRGVLLASALGVVLVLDFLVYLSVTGSRELARELDLLRASGAPEFPEQIVLPPRRAGEDPNAWWARMDGARQSLEIRDIPACAARLTAGESETDVDDACTSLLRDPRRLAALTDCERTVLVMRADRNSTATELALQVARFAPFDWRSAWAHRDQTAESVLVVPKIAGYFASIDVLTQDAVRWELEGDSDRASLRLAAALDAVRLLEDSPTIITFLGWQLGWSKWICCGLLPVLELSGADADFQEIDATLASIDVKAQFLFALRGERATGNGIYRWVRELVDRNQEPAQELLGGPVRNGLGMLPYVIWLDHDQATYLALFRNAIEAAGATRPLDAWRDHDQRAENTFDGSLGSRGLLVCAMMFPKLLQAALAAEGLRAQLMLARAAIVARRDGHEAARAFLDACLDPFSDQPLRSRLEGDGILVMWSVGKNGEDDPPGPPVDDEDKASRDDVRVLVRARPR